MPLYIDTPPTGRGSPPPRWSACGSVSVQLQNSIHVLPLRRTPLRWLAPRALSSSSYTVAAERFVGWDHPLRCRTYDAYAFALRVLAEGARR